MEQTLDVLYSMFQDFSKIGDTRKVVCRSHLRGQMDKPKNDLQQNFRVF